MLEDDPAVAKLNWFLCKSRALRGDKAGAAEAAERGLSYFPEDPMTLGFGVAAHAICGNEARAAELRGKLQFLAQIRYVPFVAQSFAYDRPGSAETYFSLVDRAIEEREPMLRTLRMASRLMVHASDPKYRLVREKIGLGEKDFAQTAAIDLPGQALG